MPARDYYDPEGMSIERKEEFDKWNKERVAENYEFHFRNELVDYCRSDVELLHEGCKVFREEFQAIAGFDPMDQCMTIASACNCFYRTKCMQEQTLATEPVRGWEGKGKPHSLVSLEWLLYQDSQTIGTIPHARNGGERDLTIKMMIMIRYPVSPALTQNESVGSDEELNEEKPQSVMKVSSLESTLKGSSYHKDC
ncbi:hypothetical protein ACROYT_G014963 [Oculina patagonica]